MAILGNTSNPPQFHTRSPRSIQFPIWIGILFGCGMMAWGQTGEKLETVDLRSIPQTVPPLLLRPPDPIPVKTVQRLTWDAYVKEKTAIYGQTHIGLKYWATNTTDQPIQIKSLRASCGCTAAKLPKSPWTLQPGEFGDIDVTVDLRGKQGTLSKGISVITSYGVERLNFNVNIPRAPSGEDETARRARNMQIANADPQAIFKNDCRACHVTPGQGKFGKTLYDAACGICHEAEHRATMVTDLHALKTASTEDYWRQIIDHGKPDTLMPAFSQAKGGPLTPQQVDSLVTYLITDFKRRAPATPPEPNSPPRL